MAAAIERDDARVMWVGAHPDDESLVGPILARACKALKRPCLLFVMNRGDGGECLRWPNCNPTLAEVRAEEMREVARRLGAQLEHHAFWNAPLPIESFPPRHEIAKKWLEQADPAELVAKAIRRFKPTVLLTFDPDRGFTGHPEHQLASRFAMAGIVRAGDVHRVANAYNVVNHLWLANLAGRADPGEHQEEFETHVPCGAPNRTCLDVAFEVARAHRTQAKDMRTIRALRPQLGSLYVRRVDPWVEVIERPPTAPP